MDPWVPPLGEVRGWEGRRGGDQTQKKWGLEGWGLEGWEEKEKEKKGRKKRRKKEGRKTNKKEEKKRLEGGPRAPAPSGGTQRPEDPGTRGPLISIAAGTEGLGWSS